MDVKMAQTCMAHGIAVMYQGKRYYRINAITSRKYIAGEPMDTRPPRMQAELYDGIGNGVITAEVSALTLIKEGGETGETDRNV